MVKNNVKNEGNRGDNALKGWWIGLDEAKERGQGEKWWKNSGIRGETIPARQHDASGPKDRPIWLFENGDMYLGEWTMRKKPRVETRSNKKFKAHPVEQGRGITYNFSPRGKVFIGDFQNGLITGSGKSFWLKSCSIWKRNKFSQSEINQGSDKVPYNYTGNYIESNKNDPSATVTLKDGTTRVGPWKDGSPVGDWWKTHLSAATHQRGLEDDEDESAKPASRKRSSTNTANKSKSGAAPTQRSKRRKQEETVFSTSQRRRNQFSNSAGFGDSEDKGPSKPTKRASRSDTTASRKKKTLSSIDRQGHRQPPRVISLDDESSNESGVAHNLAASTRDGSEARVGTLCDWLMVVIGHDPIQTEMKSYAKHFIQLGLHSPDMIQDYLTRDEVEGFEWMKPFHKLALNKNAGLKN